jgi:transposase
VVVHSSTQDQRRQQSLARELQTSSTTLEAAVREATQQEYCCHADAEAAAAQLRALQSAYHWVEVLVEERPKYGPGRPSQTQPRVVKALRYGLLATLHERAEVIARRPQETGCFVLLTNVPTAGEMAHSAGEILRAYKEPHGVEQNCTFVKDPVMVNRLFLKKPERIEALGLVLWLALLLWRLVERALRVHVETTGSPLTGWDNKETQKPTAFMMMTTFAAVMVINVGGQRQLAYPLSTVQQPYLLALQVPTTYCTAPQRGSRDEEGQSRSEQSPSEQRWMGQTEGEKPWPGGKAAPRLHTRPGSPRATPV